MARFSADLSALGWPPESDQPANGTSKPHLGLAVSGGPDSTALLLLAASAFPGNIAVATVDHGLRAESAKEAEIVAGWCHTLGAAHTTLTITVAPGNIQANARTARYQALGQWARDQQISAIATAHHADDQAETLILRLNRSSGASGLAGVRARGTVPGNPAITLLRPLLSWRRAELGSIVRQAGITAIEDPSNTNDRFDRARLRKALSAASWLDIPAIAASASHLADANDALNWAAGHEWQEYVRNNGEKITYSPHAPRAIALIVLNRIVAGLDRPARGSAIAQVYEALRAGEAASIGNLVARPVGALWSFEPAPPRHK